MVAGGGPQVVSTRASPRRRGTAPTSAGAALARHAQPAGHDAGWSAEKFGSGWRQRAAALVEAARSLALETGVASVTLTAVATRAGIHYSAVRRYFTSHKEVLLHLAAEGWARWSGTVCDELGKPGPKSPTRVAETLANGLAADPLFCDLLSNLHLHLEHEVEIGRVVEIRRNIAAAAVALADAIEGALPALGRSGAFDILIAAYSLAAAFWQIANPPERLTDAYAEEPEALPPEWNIDFASALTRVLTATCIGLTSES
jgi:AcrR family transcriptional regulator